MLRVVSKAAETKALSVSELLKACEIFVHGSTIATNTLLEKKGAKVGLLTTAGFRDNVEIRRGHRENPWDHRAPFPPVLIPRYLRLPVPERMERDGSVTQSLNVAVLDSAVETLRREGVEAVAVGFYNSYANDGTRENQAAATLRKAGVQLAFVNWLSVSSQIAPLVGEYERTSTAVLDAAGSGRMD